MLGMMMWLLLFLVIGAAGVAVLIAMRGQQAAAAVAAKAAAAKRATPAKAEKDIAFRAHGERGWSRAVYGDVMCADGVYLPMVWEADFHTSFDGRWIRTGNYAGSTPKLVDRKTRNSWNLTPAEAAAVDSVHWRLPRWSGNEINESGLADDAHTIFSDARFTAWVNQNIHSPMTPLTAVRDLWVPWDGAPTAQDVAPPDLPQPPAGGAALTAQRYLPATLRDVAQPLQAWSKIFWQLEIRGDLQPWVIEAGTPVLWRSDGLAMAVYAYEIVQGQRQQNLQLAAWSVGGGWVSWPDTVPTGRKLWTVQAVRPALQDAAKPAAKPSAPAAGKAAATATAPAPSESVVQPAMSTSRALQAQVPLVWDGNVLMQRVQADLPQLEHLHAGRTLTQQTSSQFGAVGHRQDGRLLLQAAVRTGWYWRRDLDARRRWQAQSAVVGRYPLLWTLAQEARDVPGASAGYQLHYGSNTLAGVWELEHVVVQGRWAVLMAHGASTGAWSGAGTQVQLWDGGQLHAMRLPGLAVRLRAAPVVQGRSSARVDVLLHTGYVPALKADPQLPVWQWPVVALNVDGDVPEDMVPVYTWRTLQLDAADGPTLLPPWRMVNSPQHPCADGDYVWRHQADALWWWGGVQLPQPSADWAPQRPRGEGVCFMRSGVVLCGVGPAAAPHPGGEGWVVLECVTPANGRSEPGNWRFHWVQPQQREVRTLEVQAWMPVFGAWDEHGLQWSDSAAPAPAVPKDAEAASAATPAEAELLQIQVLVREHWHEGELQRLQQGPGGYWWRKSDLPYAEQIIAREPRPWGKVNTAQTAF